MMKLLKQLFLILCILPYLSCAVFQTKQNDEPNLSIAQPKSKESKLTEAAQVYHQALHAMQEADHQKAEQLWKKYLNHYPGLYQYEHAEFYYGVTLRNLGNYNDAAQMVALVAEATKDAWLAVESRLILAELFLKIEKPEEALATTFDVLPDVVAEKQVGFKRQSLLPTIELKQRIRLYVLRASIYANLKKKTPAELAAKQARSLLKQEQTSELLLIADQQLLTAALATAELDILTMRCRTEVQPLKSMSEAEFLSYSNNYYRCIEPAQQLFCQVFVVDDKALSRDTLLVYKNLVFEPIKLKDQLPPPARKIHHKEEKLRYEQELKTLIEHTVQQHSKAYSNLDSCHAYNLF